VPGVRDVRTLGWPLMVVVGVLGCGRTSVAGGWALVVGVLAGIADLHTQALSRRDGRRGSNTPPRRPVI
jgi:hypothetical protein